MGSLKFSIALEKFDPKKLNPTVSSSYFHVGRACIVNSMSRVTNAKINNSISEDIALSLNNDLLLNESAIEQKPRYPNEDKFRGVNKERKRIVGPRVGLKRVKWERELEGLFVKDVEIDVNYSAISSELSLEQCNAVLKRLENSFSDTKALTFFEWMRRNGKLEGNVNAYNLAFRVLGRREDWGEAEKMIWEMENESGCELGYQIFNTLIYACSKLGRIELGTRWFRMMLERGVQPNVASFGMVMGLYQKGWNVEEAEFTFARMRDLGIVCNSAYSAMITIYTRLNLYEKAEDVIGFMREDRVIPNLDNWLVMLNAYSQQGKLEDAELMLVSMQKVGFPPNLVAFNTLITGYGKAGKMDAAQRIFRIIKNVGLEPDETTYRSMIEGWGRADNYKEAHWYFMELKKSGYRPNASNLYTLINLQAKYDDENGAVTTLGDMVEIGCQHASILGIVMQAYDRAERIDKVPLILKGSFYQHVLVNQTSCSIVVMAYVKNNLVDEAIRMLGDKVWKDPGFEENLYHLLICSCKELGHLENAVKIYTQMPKFDDKPNMHIMCTMMDIHSMMGQYAEAEKLYVEIKASGVALDMIGYTIVLRMYVKAGSLNDACSVLDAMDKQNDIIPDIHLLRDMLRLYQRCDKQDKLSELYYKILRSKMPWDQEMYNCVINCCSCALPVDEISRLFDEMLKRGFVPNTITINVLLNLYGKSKLFRKARKLLLMAQKWDLVDVISYNTLIAAYGRNKKFKKMRSTAKTMKFKGFSVSLEAYNSMLHAYGKVKQMKKFRSVLYKMKKSNCISDSYTYNIMINIYGEKGWIDEVASVLVDLKECGIKPDLCSYNTLIKAYGIAGMVQDAVGLVKEMRENGIEPDKITYVNLINALQRNDEFLEAVKWSLWMKQMGV